MSDPEVLASLRRAVEAVPHDVGLRRHYARMLLEAGEPARALGEASIALQADPADADALALVTAAAAQLGGDAPGEATAALGPADVPAPSAPAFDWRRAETDVGSAIPDPFLDDDESDEDEIDDGEDADDSFARLREGEPVDGADLLGGARETVTLADVGGLDDVKARLSQSFLEPMRHPEIAQAFGSTLRGGLLLYGPPGCGKTFLARAVAGELQARFLTVTLSDVLDSYIGQSEKNLHQVFQKARRLAPAVLFLDEVDALGGKRSGLGSSTMRGVVNQLLLEMDSMASDNDGLFVLGATNHPWDIDTALLRPGRFDRSLLVLPPDEPAREAILRHHLEKRIIAGIQLAPIVAKTDGFSGADLEHLCTTAAEKAMTASIAAGEVRPIGMPDLLAALDEVKPSVGPWLSTARNVATYGNADGRYDDLVAYLKKRKLY